MVPAVIFNLIIRSLIGTVERNTFSQIQMLIYLLPLFRAATSSSKADISNASVEASSGTSLESCIKFTNIAMKDDFMTLADEIRRINDLTVKLGQLDNKCRDIVSIFLDRFGKRGHFPEEFQKAISVPSVLAAALDPKFTDFDSTKRIPEMWSSSVDLSDVSDQELAAIQTLMGSYVEHLWFMFNEIDSVENGETPLTSLKEDPKFNAIRAALILVSALNGVKLWKGIQDLLPILPPASSRLAYDKERIEAFLGRFKADGNPFKSMFEEFRRFRKSRTAEVSYKIPWIDAFFVFYMDPSQCNSPGISGLVQREAVSVARLGCHLNSSEGFEKARGAIIDEVLVGVEESRKQEEQYMATIIGKMKVGDRLAFFEESQFLVNPKLGLVDIISKLLVYAPQDRDLYDKFKSMKHLSLSSVCGDLLSRKILLLNSATDPKDILNILNNQPFLLPALIGSDSVNSVDVVKWLKLDTKCADNLNRIRSQQPSYESVYERILSRTNDQTPTDVIRNYISSDQTSDTSFSVKRIQRAVEAFPPDADIEASPSAVTFKDNDMAMLKKLPVDTRVLTADITDDQKGVMADIFAFTHPTAVDQLFYFHYTLHGKMESLMTSVGKHFVNRDLRECMKKEGVGSCEGADSLVEKYPLVGLFFAVEPEFAVDKVSGALPLAKIESATLRNFRKSLQSFPGTPENGLFLLAALSLSRKKSETPVAELMSKVSRKSFWPFMEALIPVMSDERPLLELLSTRLFTERKFILCEGATSIISRGFLSISAINAIELACTELSLFNALLEEARNEWRHCLKSPDDCQGHDLSPLQKVAIMTDSYATTDNLSAILRVEDGKKQHLEKVIQMVDRTNTAVVLLRALLGRGGDVNAVLTDFADPPTQELFAVYLRIPGGARARICLKYPNMLQETSSGTIESRLADILSMFSTYATRYRYQAVVQASDTVFWNGLQQAWKKSFVPADVHDKIKPNMFVSFAELFSDAIQSEKAEETLDRLKVIKSKDHPPIKSIFLIHGLVEKQPKRYQAVYETMMYAGWKHPVQDWLEQIRNVESELSGKEAAKVLLDYLGDALKPKRYAFYEANKEWLKTFWTDFHPVKHIKQLLISGLLPVTPGLVDGIIKYVGDVSKLLDDEYKEDAGSDDFKEFVRKANECRGKADPYDDPICKGVHAGLIQNPTWGLYLLRYNHETENGFGEQRFASFLGIPSRLQESVQKRVAEIRMLGSVFLSQETTFQESYVLKSLVEIAASGSKDPFKDFINPELVGRTLSHDEGTYGGAAEAESLISCENAIWLLEQEHCSNFSLSAAELNCENLGNELNALLGSVRSALVGWETCKSHCAPIDNLSPIAKLAIMTDAGRSESERMAALGVLEGNADFSKAAACGSPLLLRALVGCKGDILLMLNDFANPEIDPMFKVLQKLPDKLRSSIHKNLPDILRAPVEGANSPFVQLLSRLDGEVLKAAYQAVTSIDQTAFYKALEQLLVSFRSNSINLAQLGEMLKGNKAFVLVAALRHTDMEADHVFEAEVYANYEKIPSEWISNIRIALQGDNMGRAKAVFELLMFEHLIFPRRQATDSELDNFSLLLDYLASASPENRFQIYKHPGTWLSDFNPVEQIKFLLIAGILPTHPGLAKSIRKTVGDISDMLNDVKTPAEFLNFVGNAIVCRDQGEYAYGHESCKAVHTALKQRPLWGVYLLKNNHEGIFRTWNGFGQQRFASFIGLGQERQAEIASKIVKVRAFLSQKNNFDDETVLESLIKLEADRSNDPFADFIIGVSDP